MFVDVPGGKLFALRCGPERGSAILAIGGWIGSSELWLETLGYLSDEYVTLSYDHRGSGVSRFDPQSITFEALVSDALAVLDAFGVDRCVLAAESSGAQTALAVAAQFPNRISHLVIVDGLYSRRTTEENDPFLQGLRAAYPATIERFIQLCFPEPDVEHIKDWGRKILARAEPSAAIALRRVSFEADVTSELGRVTQPVLVLHGSIDQIVPLETGKALAAVLPDAEFEVFEGCGHVPTLTQPKRLADAIRAFLRQREA